MSSGRTNGGGGRGSAGAPPSEARARPSGHLPASSSTRPASDEAPTLRDELLTTGDMARLSCNTLRTVRFYEEEEILRPARRTEGGHRLFPRSELDRLMLVTELREAGMSLEEIKQVLAIKSGASSGADASRRASEMLEGRVRALESKLKVLTRLQSDLARTLDLVSACVECDEGTFPNSCKGCERMSSQGDMSRSMRVLWSLDEPVATAK